MLVKMPSLLSNDGYLRRKKTPRIGVLMYIEPTTYLDISMNRIFTNSFITFSEIAN